MPASFASPAVGVLAVSTNGDVTLYPPSSGYQDIADIGHVIIRLE
jgi:hypothetical protein